MPNTPGPAYGKIRFALDIGQIEFAARSGVGSATLARLELGGTARETTIRKVENALEAIARERGFRVWFGPRWGVRKT